MAGAVSLMLAMTATHAQSSGTTSCPDRFQPPREAAGTPAAQATAQRLAEELQHSDHCKAMPQVSVGRLDEVWAMYMHGTHIGGKRFETQTPPGLPVGSVLGTPQGGLAFDLAEVANEGVRRLVVMDDRRAILDLMSPAQTIVNTGRLRPGQTYRWELVTGAQTYQGSATLMAGEDAQEVRRRVAALDRQGLPPAARLFYLAAIFDDEGLYADRDAVLAQLRRLN